MIRWKIPERVKCNFFEAGDEKILYMQIFHYQCCVALHLVISVVIISCVYHKSLVFLHVLPLIEYIQTSLEIGTTPICDGRKVLSKLP